MAPRLRGPSTTYRHSELKRLLRTCTVAVSEAKRLKNYSALMAMVYNGHSHFPTPMDTRVRSIVAVMCYVTPVAVRQSQRLYSQFPQILTGRYLSSPKRRHWGWGKGVEIRSNLLVQYSINTHTWHSTRFHAYSTAVRGCLFINTITQGFGCIIRRTPHNASMVVL